MSEIYSACFCVLDRVSEGTFESVICSGDLKDSGGDRLAFNLCKSERSLVDNKLSDNELVQ